MHKELFWKRMIGRHLHYTCTIDRIHVKFDAHVEDVIPMERLTVVTVWLTSYLLADSGFKLDAIPRSGSYRIAFDQAGGLNLFWNTVKAKWQERNLG